MMSLEINDKFSFKTFQNVSKKSLLSKQDEEDSKYHLLIGVDAIKTLISFKINCTV